MRQSIPAQEDDMAAHHPLLWQAKAYSDGKILNLLVFFICTLNIVGADSKIIMAAYLAALFQMLHLWIEGVSRRRVTLPRDRDDEAARVR